MDMAVTFLGTGGSVPSARRSTAAVLVSRGGERLLFDCGEGTQRQMQRSTGLVALDEIYLTHLHLDHFLGLPGLLKTYDLQDREQPLVIYGPPGLKKLFLTLDPLIGRLRYDAELVEINPGENIPHGDYEVQPFAVEHRMVANGYAIVEDDRPGRFDPERAQELGVAPGPDFAALQRGEEIAGADGPVRSEDVMGEDRDGRIVVITGDTVPCDATVDAARGAQLLIHDASFLGEDADRAADTGHSTAGGAAALAADAEVELLALVHISARYHVVKVLEEAKEEFEGAVAPRDFDVIELPFPERGGPRLIPDGARNREPAAVKSTDSPPA